MRPARRGPLAALTPALALALAVAGAAWSAPRDAETRRLRLELARTLGEAHALKTVCRPDQTLWRDRFVELLTVEKPDAPSAAALAQAFRDGFERTRARRPACSPQVFLDEGAAARRGRELADRLARAS